MGIVGFGKLGMVLSAYMHYCRLLPACTLQRTKRNKTEIYLVSGRVCDVPSGRYLYEALVSEHSADYEVVFVWNRSADKMQGVVPPHLVLLDLCQAATK